MFDVLSPHQRTDATSLAEEKAADWTGGPVAGRNDFYRAALSVVIGTVEALLQMIMAARPLVDLVQTSRAVAEWHRFAMQVLVMQVYFIVEIGCKVVPRVWSLRTLSHHSATDIRRKMIDVFRIPRRVFDNLSARACASKKQNDGTNCQTTHGGSLYSPARLSIIQIRPLADSN
jgi:hypothetical protein